MAEEILAGVLVELLKNLGALAAEQIGLAWGVEKDLEKLKSSFDVIESELEDADDMQLAKNKAAQKWLKKLKDVAYDVEDVMDEFSYEALRQELEIQNRIKNKVRNFFSRSNPFAFRFKMAIKIKDINAKLDEIVENMRKWEIIKRNVGVRDPQPSNNSDRETHSFVDQSKIVGREEDKRKLVAMLTDPTNQDDQSLSVIPIVGIGGLGKTTLAQLVYNDEQVKKHFADLKMWVCVSDGDFDVKKLARDIIESADKSKLGDDSSLDVTACSLEKKLGGKKFLLVLDDVWNEDRDKWEKLRAPLHCGAKGSKIIVTTRLEEVANIMGTLPAHKLVPLSDDESWSLFKQRAFGVAEGGGEAEEMQNLVDIGKQIVKKCKGVPLALKAIGGALYSKREEREWSLILNSELWDLREDENKILPALRLSYDHLPSRLKQCFSFCSIFYKDEEIEVERLIRLWMAEGLLQSHKENMEMEDVGYEYFKELLSKSFFQLDKDSVRQRDIIHDCKMHDLVHDLAQSISRSECCVFDIKRTNDISELQRLRLFFNEETSEILKATDMPKKLHLIFIESIYYPRMEIENVSLLMNLKSLRVLILRRIGIKELPDSGVKLKHLRYLELVGIHIEVLPTWITRLYHLQTIKVRYCRKVKQLPSNIEKLINLRHFDVDADILDRTEMPKGIGKLKFLQNLSSYRVGKEKGRRIEELKHLNHLRGGLAVIYLKNVRSREDAENANLKQKRGIGRLGLGWNYERENNNGDAKYNVINDEEVLEGLQPHPNLKELRIFGFKGVRFPKWLTHEMLPNLEWVYLHDLSNCEYLPALGLFTSLKSLNIDGMHSLKRIGIEFYGGAAHSPTPSFPSLTTLELENLENLEEWVEGPTLSLSPSSPSSSWSPSSFRSLEYLSIQGCPNLRTMPTFFPSLRMLKVGGNSVVEMMLGKCKDEDEEEGSSNNTGNQRELIPLPTNLRFLTIEDCTFPSLPKRIQHFTGLETLNICNFTNMEALPEWLGSLASLQSLGITLCIRLMYMPSAEAMRRLCALRELGIYWCPCMAGEVTFSIVDKLAKLLVQEASLLGGGVHEEVKWLEGELSQIKAFLQDADNQRAAIEKAKNLVLRITEVFYDAEDVIDAFILKKAQRRRMTFIKRDSFVINNLTSHHKVKNEIKRIRTRICSILDHRLPSDIQNTREVPSSSMSEALKEQR